MSVGKITLASVWRMDQMGPGWRQAVLGGSGSLEGKDHGSKDEGSHSRMESKYRVRKRSQDSSQSSALDNWVASISIAGKLYWRCLVAMTSEPS